MNRTILVRAVEVVVFLFAAFSGYFINIAPPEELNSRFAVGTSSMVALVILLLVSSVARSRQRVRYRKYWHAASALALTVAVVFSFLYFDAFGKSTFSYDVGHGKKEIFVAGTELTEAGIAMARKNGTTAPEILVKSSGPMNRELLWSSESIQRAKTTLLTYYLLMTVGFSVAIFCITEGLLKQRSAT